MYHWPICWMICFIPCVRLSFPLTTGNPVYLISTRVHGVCDLSAEDVHSFKTPDPTFAFVVLPYLLFFYNDYVLHIVNLAILYFKFKYQIYKNSGL
jgi:hypothetical protein